MSFAPGFEDRFWAKVDKRGPTECWEWRAARTKDGYGNICSLKAHRVSWELHFGVIPKGEGYHGTCVCHHCDNPRCACWRNRNESKKKRNTPGAKSTMTRIGQLADGDVRLFLQLLSAPQPERTSGDGAESPFRPISVNLCFHQPQRDLT